MKILIFLIAAALAVGPAAAQEVGNNYPYPCSYPLGITSPAGEVCSCNGNKGEVPNSFASLPIGWGMTNAVCLNGGCPGDEATIYGTQSGPIYDSYVVPDGMCLPAGQEICWWLDDNTKVTTPACDLYEGMISCNGGDAYTSKKTYGYVDMSELKACPG